MYQFTIIDLKIFALAWVANHCSCSPGSEESQIWQERIFKELLRVFGMAEEPIN